MIHRYARASLQTRLLITGLGVLLLLWVLTVVATWADTRHEVQELLDAHLAQSAGLLLAESTELAGAPHQVLEVPDVHRYQPRAAFQVWQSGTLHIRSASAPEQPMADIAARGFADVTLRGESWRVFVHEAEGQIIMVGERERTRRDVIMASLRSTLWPLLVAAPLVAFALAITVRRSLEPMRRITSQIESRAPGDLGRLPLDDVPTDLRPMVQAIDALLERVESLLESERRFNADAAHELRTPIAGIRMQAQVAMGARDAASRHEALEAVLEGCDRASQRIDRLLMLARLDARDASAMQGDVVAAIQADWPGWKAQAEARHQHLMRDVPVSPIHVALEPDLLHVLFDNLLVNALRYSPEGANIQVSVSVLDEHWVAACIEDSGPGVHDEQLARLGERFFRVPGSDVRGSGLGWSIVQRIVALNGGSIQASRSEDLGGLRVSLRLRRV